MDGHLGSFRARGERSDGRDLDCFQYRVKSEIIYKVSMEGDVILSVQPLQLIEVAELRWNSATELIRVEMPERATTTP